MTESSLVLAWGQFGPIEMGRAVFGTNFWCLIDSIVRAKLDNVKGKFEKYWATLEFKGPKRRPKFQVSHKWLL